MKRVKRMLWSAGLTMGFGALVAAVIQRYRQLPANDTFADDESGVDSGKRETVMQHNIAVNVGDQVFLEEGGEEIGAVRKVERDHLVVYIEAAGDFVIRGPEITAVHHGKVILAPDKVEGRLLDAARGAHEREVF
ncbi:MAG TPA: hypothetical protein VMZ53_16990 [Kofleriaceae bacterium]|nr:hypothetical protein [Kofleriaceae bacterium]